MLNFQWRALLRRQSNSKHYVLTILDVKVKGAKHIPSEWFSILLPCKQLRRARSKKLSSSKHVKWNILNQCEYGLCQSDSKQHHSQTHTGRGTISNQSLLCYLIYSCVVSCTSCTFPHVIIPSQGLFSSNKNHFKSDWNFLHVSGHQAPAKNTLVAEHWPSMPMASLNISVFCCSVSGLVPLSVHSHNPGLNNLHTTRLHCLCCVCICTSRHGSVAHEQHSSLGRA